MIENSTSVIRFETVDAKDMSALHPNGLTDLYRSDKDGFLVKNFLSQDEVRSVLDNFHLMDSKAVANTSVGYTYPMIFAEFSLRNAELNEEELKVRARDYFLSNDDYAAEFKADFGFDIKARLDDFLSSLSGGRSIEVPIGMSDVGHYPFGNFRYLKPHGGGMSIHCGNYFQNRFRLFYSHLTRSAQVVNQMSYFIMIQPAEVGGDLQIFDLRWEDGQTKTDNLENKEVIMPDGRRIYPDTDPAYVKFKISPQPGDLILFQGGNIWHRVTPIEGNRPRITFGGFIAPNLAQTGFYYWS